MKPGKTLKTPNRVSTNHLKFKTMSFITELLKYLLGLLGL